MSDLFCFSSYVWPRPELRSEPALPRLDAEANFQLMQGLVGNGVHKGQVRDFQIDFGGFFGCLDQTEGLVQVPAGGVYAVLCEHTV